MTATIMQVARTLGHASGWSLSNLELQKMAYIAEMIHLGRTNTPLIYEDWQAWDYGPVQPELYHKAKVFGAGPVKDIFLEPVLSAGTLAHKAVADTYESMRKMSAGQMVAITHRPAGAWATNYNPGRKGTRIPKEAIAAEYATLVNDD